LSEYGNLAGRHRGLLHQSHPGILRAAWGFTVETATRGLRFVLSGVFDAHPGLKVILGHMGEGLPFLLWRISHGLRATMKEETFCDGPGYLDSFRGGAS
jgi:predicted TIM-barrel fold metal-dependent hydrolase